MKLIIAFAFLAFSPHNLMAEQDTASLFSNDTLLRDLPTHLILRVTKDILVNPNAATIYFRDGKSSQFGSHCILGACRVGQNYCFFRQTLAFHGCEIVLKRSSSEPSVIKKGTMLEIEDIQTETLRWTVGEFVESNGFLTCSGSISQDVPTVKLIIKNSEVQMVRCGEPRSNFLDKGFLSFHMRSLSLFAAPLRQIE